MDFSEGISFDVFLRFVEFRDIVWHFFRVLWVFHNNYNTPIPILYPYLGFSHKSILLVFVFFIAVLFFL